MFTRHIDCNRKTKVTAKLWIFVFTVNTAGKHHLRIRCRKLVLYCFIPGQLPEAERSPVASVKENDVIPGVEIFFEVKDAASNDIYLEIRENITRIKFVTHLFPHIGCHDTERRKLGVFF